MHSKSWRALVVIGFLLVSCTGKNRSSSVETPDGVTLDLKPSETLRINVSSEPPTLNWIKATDATSSHLIYNLMDGLVGYNLADKELGLMPALATEWKASEKARVWTFKLRSGVKWTDGVDFKAQHVLDGWRLLLARETASEYAYFLFVIKNAKAFNEGKVPWEQVGVSMPSANEIKVELEKPMSYFPHLMAHPSSYPVRLDVMQKWGDKWTEAGHLVGLGPYRLAAWQHDKQIVLEANSTYYGGVAPTKFVHVQMIQEQTTAMNLFDSGRLDAVDGVPSTELKKARARTDEFRQIGVLQLYYYGMNTQKPPMNDVNVRRAIAHAIDRQKLVQLLGGGQIPMTSWIPSGMFGYSADVGLEFNLERAKASLAKAGFGEGKKKLPKIEIHFNTNEDHQRIAEAVQAQLKENLGIEVELKNQEWKSYLAQLNTEPPPLFRFGWLADYPDPDNFMNLMTSYSDNNRTRWKDSRYDKLIEEAASETDREKRRDLYKKASKILLEEGVAAVPLMTSVAHLLVSKRVESFPVNALRRFEYKSVRLKN